MGSSRSAQGQGGAPASEQGGGSIPSQTQAAQMALPHWKPTEGAHGADTGPLSCRGWAGATALRKPHSAWSRLLSNSPIRLSSNRDLISAILSRAFRRMLRAGRRERRHLDEA